MEQKTNFIKTYETLSEVYNLYNSYKDKEQFFLYLNDEMGISHYDLTYLYDNLRNYIGVIDKLCNEEDFMITLINGTRIITNEYDSFYKNHFSCNPYKRICNNDDERMFSMLNMIDNYMNEKNNFYSLIYNIVKKENILYEDLKVYAEYVNGYCYNYSVNGISNFRMKSVYNFRKMYDLYRKILSDPKFVAEVCKKDNEKFVSFICCVKVINGVTPKILKRSLSQFKCDEDIENFIAKYDKCFSNYENKKNIQKRKEHFEYAYSVVKNYIDGDFKNIKEYCDSINSTTSTFENYVGIMKKANDPIYIEYSSLENAKREANLEYMHNCIDTVLSYIRNGIEEDGIVRDFDLLDYYSYTDISFKELKKVAREYLTNSKDLLTLSLFVSNYENDKIISKKSVDEIYDTKDIIFCEFDNDGNIINPGYEITTDDKKQIMNLLSEMNIPLTVKTYSLMRNRYIKKEILNEYNKNTIKR